MNRYPNGAVNRWDGEGLELNEKNGTIIGTAFAAGHKNPNNTFSGVMLGDWDKGAEGDVEDSVGALTGVYGLHEGEVSYAFMEDGTAFIGKSGDGRIYFDGDNSEIYSAGYKNNKPGMMIDLGGNGDPYIHLVNNDAEIKLTAEEGGSSIYFKGTGGYIKIDSSSSSKPLQIDDHFWVEWNGDLHAVDAYLEDAFLQNAYLSSGYFTGEIVADQGVIGGWKINGQTLEGGTTTFNTPFENLEEGEEAYSWTAASPKILLDATNASIWGGILRPSTDDAQMKLYGALSVYNDDGTSVTTANNYFGAIMSNNPSANAP
jgi:hypothetical protein